MKTRALVLACVLSLIVPVTALAGDGKKPLARQPDPFQVTADQTPAGLPEGGVTIDLFGPDGILLATDTAVIAFGTEWTDPAVVAPASASGCLSVDAWRNKYTLLGFLAYRWHQTKYFCWSGGAVNSVSVGYYVSDNDGTNYFRGLLSSDTW